MAAFRQYERVRAPSARTPWTILRGTVLVAALFAGLHGACTAAYGQSGSSINAVLTDKDAYLLLPAELISGPMVKRSSQSPGGQNVTVLREVMRARMENLPSAANPKPPMPAMEQELIFWNAAVRKPVTLWESSNPLVQVSLSDWMPGTASLFATIDESAPREAGQAGQEPAHAWKVLLLGLGLERAYPLALPTGGYDAIQVSVSPLQPLAVAQLFLPGADQPPIFYLIHQNGRVGARIDAPTPAYSSVIWDATGSPILSVIQKNDSVRRRSFYSVDTRTGQTRLLSISKAPPPPDARRSVHPTLPFHIVTRRHDVAQADSVEHISPLWLETDVKSESPRAMLTANGAAVSLLPEANGVIFSTQNALWFTPILKTNKVEYLTARRAALRAVAMSNARQLGLAAIMFAQDNDEVLPGPDGVQDKLGPYLGSDTLFQGFTYTYPGSTLADIAAPAETILGHVDGPGGRAVIYADGHVKWADN